MLSPKDLAIVDCVEGMIEEMFAAPLDRLNKIKQDILIAINKLNRAQKEELKKRICKSPKRKENLLQIDVPFEVESDQKYNRGVLIPTKKGQEKHENQKKQEENWHLPAVNIGGNRQRISIDDFNNMLHPEHVDAAKEIINALI